nr:hypothetical protein [Marseillevirus cajuinensis]
MTEYDHAVPKERYAKKEEDEMSYVWRLPNGEVFCRKNTFRNFRGEFAYSEEETFENSSQWNYKKTCSTRECWEGSFEKGEPQGLWKICKNNRTKTLLFKNGNLMEISSHGGKRTCLFSRSKNKDLHLHERAEKSTMSVLFSGFLGECTGDTIIFFNRKAEKYKNCMVLVNDFTHGEQVPIHNFKREGFWYGRFILVRTGIKAMCGKVKLSPTEKENLAFDDSGPFYIC